MDGVNGVVLARVLIWFCMYGSLCIVIVCVVVGARVMGVLTSFIFSCDSCISCSRYLLISPLLLGVWVVLYVMCIWFERCSSR